MRAYLITTATLFGLLAVMHVVHAAMAMRGTFDGTDVGVTAGIGVVAAVFCVWAVRLLRSPAPA
jgi:hypothetical protein